MKYFTRTLLVLFLVGNTLSGQVSIGVGGGIQLPAILNQNNYGYRELPYSVKLGGQLFTELNWEITQQNSINIGLGINSLGQSYAGTQNDMRFTKQVGLTYVMLPITYEYAFRGFQESYNKKGKKVIVRSSTYIGAGFSISKLIHSSFSSTREGEDTNFLEFVTGESGYNNPNEQELKSRGEPEDFKELFQDIDVMLIGFLGRDLGQFGNGLLSIEGRGGLGVMDMNNKAWRLPNRLGDYGPSFNAYAAILVRYKFNLK